MTDLHALDHARGHSLVPTVEELAAIPKLYETDGQPFLEKKIYLKYFAGSSATWHIAEVDPEPDSWILFGHCDLGLGFPEWGSVDLHELASLSVRTPQGFPIYAERDLQFLPKLWSEVVHD